MDSMNDEYKLKTPVPGEVIKKLRIGNILWVTGTLVTARDEAHKKILALYDKGEKLPVDFSEVALIHCGPIARKQDGEWQIIAAGPTTSFRMEKLEPDFISKTGVKIIIGKGGTGEKTAAACKEHGAVYCVFPGGVGLLAARAIKKVENVFWLEELGMPEALWVFKVKNFGPLVVTIDTMGNNLTEKVIENAKKVIE